MRSKSGKTEHLAVLALLLLVSGCFRERTQREWEYMPDMYRSAAIKAQEADPDGASLMRMPPEGAVPRETEIYWPAAADTLAAYAMVNPLPDSKAVLETGKKYFNIYCIVCHGPRGAGDGPVIPKMPPPPPLTSDKVCAWPDGRIHHVIVHGQGNMPSYRSTVDAPTRWAIIRYLRVIQRAEHPLPGDEALLAADSSAVQK
ncbi:cytochrome c [bacterium]|nr:cytochrome c [bacterium]